MSITHTGDPIADRAAWLCDLAGEPSMEPPADDAAIADQVVRTCARRLGSELMRLSSMDGDPTEAAANAAHAETAEAARHLAAIEDRAQRELQTWDVQRFSTPEAEHAERANIQSAAQAGPRQLAEHLRSRWQSGGLAMALRLAKETIAEDPVAAGCASVITWAETELVPAQVRTAQKVVATMPQYRAALQAFRGSR